MSVVCIYSVSPSSLVTSMKLTFYLKECLRQRHSRQPSEEQNNLVSQRKDGIGGKEIPHLLKARFRKIKWITLLLSGITPCAPCVQKSGTQSPETSLAHAINKNPFVPPQQLMAWESVISGISMVIGKKMKLVTTPDSAKALQVSKVPRLEQNYCRLKMSPLTTDDE
jgi:hypothetical protein